MSKPLFDDPKKPLVLYIKNGDTFAELKNTFGSNVAICGQCGTIYSTQNSDSSQIASDCCKKSYCACGEEKNRYWMKCGNCVEKDRIDKAEETPDNGGMVCVFGCDEYYSDMGTLVETLHDELEPNDVWPEWASPTEEISWTGVKIDDILESALSEFDEDAIDRIVDIDELDKFVQDWNKKQTIYSCSIISGKKVRIPPRPIIED